MKKIVLFLFGLLCVAVQAKAQSQTQWQPERNKEKLLEIARQYVKANEVNLSKAKEEARRLGRPELVEQADGNVMVLTGISPEGHLLYTKVHNAEAAVDHGAVSVRPGGELGLSVTGSNIDLAVWDGGVTNRHQEFGDRVTLGQSGAGISNHATHVTGSILAAGVNPSAQGMAYEARARSYDFSGDIGEIAAEAANGLILSNHSYGQVTGWSFQNGGWVWFGRDEENEDYRFGHYDSDANAIDNITYNAPFYTVVWSAGNDRNDTGGSGHSPDGDYDCIPPNGIAKNVITVGAINHTNGSPEAPEDIRMSDFSSWGPADDGRIKPDISAVGVSVFSSTASSEDSYANMQGTSMAAPITTGNIALLQDLYQGLNNGRFMRSATVKGLLAHTAFEAGNADGPDYSFGWGMLNTKRAAEVILNNSAGVEHKMIESVLSDSVSTFDYAFVSDGSPVSATLSWTDPAGAIPEATVDNPQAVLVNDLDLRIVDDAGNEVFPWKLNKDNPGAAATKGDNLVDNVEKVETGNLEPRTYYVRVSHKGSLQDGEQAFSLLVSTNAYAANDDLLYWVGGSGEWNDGNHWALTSGGAPAGAVPGPATEVVVDENSFSAKGESIALQGDVTVGTLRWLAKDSSALNFASHTLSVGGNLWGSTNQWYATEAGTLRFVAETGKQNVLLGKNQLSGVTLEFMSGNWAISAQGASLGGLTLKEGAQLDVSGQTLALDALMLDGGHFNAVGTQFEGLDQLTVAAGTVLEDGGSLYGFASQGMGMLDVADQVLSGDVLLESGDLTLALANASIDGKTTLMGGTLVVNADAVVGEVQLMPGSGLNVNDGATLTLDHIGGEGSTDAPIVLEATTGTGTLHLEEFTKVCFDFAEVANISTTGNAVWNAGPNGTLGENTPGWFAEDCNGILFADFDVMFTCVGSYTIFTNGSSGTPDSYSWDFGVEGSGVDGLTEGSTVYTYAEAGTYEVSLRVEKGDFSHTMVRTIRVDSNSLAMPVIARTNDLLAATTSAGSYQWLLDGAFIEGATGRTFTLNGESGAFQVIAIAEDSVCNSISEQLVITGLDNRLANEAVTLMPNPATNEVLVSVEDGRVGELKVVILDALGREHVSFMAQKNHFSHQSRIDLSGMPAGVYFAHVLLKDARLVKPLIVK